MQEGVFAATPEGKLLDCNDAFVRMLGHTSRSELMALNLDRELYASPEQREKFRRKWKSTITSEILKLLCAKKAAPYLRQWRAALLPGTRAEKSNAIKIPPRHHREEEAEDEIRRRNRALNALNAMAVIATQSFDLDETSNLTFGKFWGCSVQKLVRCI